MKKKGSAAGGEGRSLTPKLRRNKDKKDEDTSMNKASTMIELSIIRGEYMPVMDANGLCDPFCKMTYQGKSFKTAVARKTLNPEWQESFAYEVTEESGMCVIELFDHDAGRRAEIIGRVYLTAADFGHHYTEKWFNVEDLNGSYLVPDKVNVTQILLGLRRVAAAEIGLGGKEFKDKPILQAILPKLKPIIESIFTVLYVVVRPILMGIIAVRKTLIDWERPGATVMWTIAFLYTWWKGYVLMIPALGVSWVFAKHYVEYVVMEREYSDFPRDDMKVGEFKAEFDVVKSELKYGVKDPITKDINKILTITAKLIEGALSAQRILYWADRDKRKVSTAIALGVPLIALFHCVIGIPFAFVLHYAFRYGILVGYLAATFGVPLTRLFPGLASKIKRNLVFGNAFSQLQRMKTTAEGNEPDDTNLRADVRRQVQSFGVNKVFKQGQILAGQGWSDFFFYASTATIRSGDNVIFKRFLRPSNLLLKKYQGLNPSFDFEAYSSFRLRSVACKFKGKVTVFDVNEIRLEFRNHPLVAFDFFKWLAVRLASKKRSVQGLATGLALNASDADAIGQFLTMFKELADDDVIGVVVGLLMNKKRQGGICVTDNHWTFLDVNGDGFCKPWHSIHECFIDKAGLLQISLRNGMTGELDKSQLAHEDPSEIRDLFKFLNQMKKFHEMERTQSPRAQGGRAASISDSAGAIANLKLRKAADKKKRGLLGRRHNHTHDHEEAPEDLNSLRESVMTKMEQMESKSDYHVSLNQLVSSECNAALTPEESLRTFKAGKIILAQGQPADVGLLILHEGVAKVVLKTKSDSEDKVIGFVQKGSVIGEACYLLERNPMATVIADTDCSVYVLPKIYLDSVLAKNKRLGAEFFEFLCLVMFERSLVAHKNLVARNKQSK